MLRALTALAGEVSRRLHRLSEDRGEIDALTPAHECAPICARSVLRGLT